MRPRAILKWFLYFVYSFGPLKHREVPNIGECQE